MQKAAGKCMLIIVVLCCWTLLTAQDTDTPRGHTSPKDLPYSTSYISSGASFGYLFSDDINIVGSYYFDFPFIFRNEKSAFLNLLVNHSVSEDGLSFMVKDIDYQITVGARDYLTKKLIVSAFISQQGTEKIDYEGSPFIRFLGFSIESSNYRNFASERGLAWRGELGGIFKTREVDGEITFKGDVRYNFLSMEKLVYGADFRIDSLINDFNTSNDWLIGPRISLRGSSSNIPSIYIYYLNSNNPLGIGDDGFILGFDYRRKIADGNFKFDIPEIHGNISAGAGEGREEGRLGLKFQTPAFKKPFEFRLSFDIDTFLLTGKDTGELYYFLTGGLEREKIGLVHGIYFYHRSNHQLAEPNIDITYLNVLELGVASRGWDRENIHDGFWMDIGSHEKRTIFNFMARAGCIIDSAFGEKRRWNLRGGMRIDLPFPSSKFSPFLLAIWEGGDVSRREIGFGIRTPLDFDVLIEYKKDGQYFGEDNDAFLFVTSMAF
ncbi:MAG: hypothetical protein AB1756_03250 [Acidobacteriota bacterium]